MTSVADHQSDVVLLCKLQTRLDVLVIGHVDGVLDIGANYAWQLAGLERVAT